MEFKEPFLVYTAASNLDAHMIVEMLNAGDVPAFAVEDQSGVSLWMLGTIGQFHKPNVWVEKSTAETATQLILRFEERRRERENHGPGTGEIHVQCEQCGETTIFSDALNGTIQECSHCDALIDVGDLALDEDFGEPDES